jgi:hypothetical protein
VNFVCEVHQLKLFNFVVSYQRDNNDMETLENMKLELAQSKEMLDERERKINEIQGKLNEQVKENKKK